MIEAEINLIRSIVSRQDPNLRIQVTSKNSFEFQDVR
jgi:hypothetical protein